jgi:hypothetical protein
MAIGINHWALLHEVVSWRRRYIQGFSMTAFRTLLVILLIAVVIYTIPVVIDEGLSQLLPTFFGDILAMTWPGQFNFDFLGFLILSATWTAWRNQFSAAGLGLALVALFGGIPFLTTYLLYLSYQAKGDIRVMLLGEGRS